MPVLNPYTRYHRCTSPFALAVQQAMSLANCKWQPVQKVRAMTRQNAMLSSPVDVDVEATPVRCQFIRLPNPEYDSHQPARTKTPTSGRLMVSGAESIYQIPPLH